MSNPETCQKYSEYMSAFIDNELDSSELDDFKKHLASCADCARELDDLQKVKDAIATLPRAEMKRELDFSFLEAAAPANACQPLIELLDAYHDGELETVERSKVEEHLKNCQPCTDKLSAIRTVASSLKSMPRLEPSRDIVGEMQFEEKSNVVPFARRNKFALVTAAAAAVALVFAFNFKPASQTDLASKPTAQTQTIASTKGANSSNSGTNEATQTVVPEQQSNNVSSPANSEIASTSGTEPPAELAVSSHTQKKDSGSDSAQKAEPKAQVAELPKATTDNSQAQQNEIALMPEISASGADALGIATDEDGLYDIKI